MKETREEKLEKWRKASKEMNENPFNHRPMNKENTTAKEYIKKIDDVYWLHLQNLNGRETEEQAFRKGIEAGVEEKEEEREAYANKRVQEALKEVEKIVIECDETNHIPKDLFYEINQIKTKYKQ